MGVSKSVAKAKRKTLAKWFPTIAEAAHNLVHDGRTAARLETVEILTDIEQVTSLFASMEEWRGGQILSMDSAFGDL